ncbi:MAG: S8 family peptidase [Chloroflexaceae bacterium]|nr:S8 family peptidase [Chloroflexaceae bacterium]
MATVTKRVFVRIIALFTMIVLFVGSSFMATSFTPAQPAHTQLDSYIVQAASVVQAEQAVHEAGGVVTQHLTIINGVAADLNPSAIAALQTHPTIRVTPNRTVYPSSEPQSERTAQLVAESTDNQETLTNGYVLYPAAASGVNNLHEQKVRTRKTECKDNRVITYNDYEERELRGWGVTVAIVDTGLMRMASSGDWKKGPNNTLFAENSGRCIVYRNFVGNPNTTGNNSVDDNGHGTHVLSTIADNREVKLAGNNSNATPVGVAPQTNLFVARALGRDGSGTYVDVIEAIEWIVQSRDTYNIRVLNLSLYAPVSGPYWADPLNQAVMKAWQAGIVVVVAAGNEGPEAGTITVPGNVPYVISVGGIKSGRYTVDGIDELASYSSRGPTESAFVKPDVLIPATRTIAPMPDNGDLSQDVKEGMLVETASVDLKIGSPHHKHNYYQLSGTSMASAQVSGVAALILQANPDLTNDQVKYRLMGTARPAWNEETDQPLYSIWEQGAGLVDAQAALFGSTTEATNLGMDIATDLDIEGGVHYWGYTTWDEATSEFRLRDPDTNEPLAVWDGGSRSWSGGSRSWSGSDSLWAGSDRNWSNVVDVPSAGGAALAGGIVDDEEIFNEPSQVFTVYMPYIVKR